MKRLIIIAKLVLLCAVLVHAQKIENLALTPPMGWNSWNCLRTSITEEKIKSIADAMRVYDNLIRDLDLKAASVPLLAGEVVGADQEGLAAYMNSIIDKLPQTLPNSYVISSKGCTDKADNLHFDTAGCRELGKRYATKMLSLIGIISNE